MTENKKTGKDESSKSDKGPVEIKKGAAKRRSKKEVAKKTTSLVQEKPVDVWEAFNDTFERFRSDFEDLLFPEVWQKAFSIIPESRVPAIDLEDREKEFLLKAEMPGFKKADIEIEVREDLVAITGNAGWTYDKKGKLYICKERACKTFYREVELPEEIEVDAVTANLNEGILEMTLPKKVPKQRRKIMLK